MTKPDWLHAELTGDIIAAAYRVFYALRHRRGYSEFNLTEALQIELQRRAHQVQRNVITPRAYRGEDIGRDRVALVVDDLVVVLVKNVRETTDVHYAQLGSYLEDGRWPIGLLVNFGGRQPVIRRIERTLLQEVACPS